MAYHIIGTDHRDGVLEYILKSDEGITFAQKLLSMLGFGFLRQTHSEVRDNIFDNLASKFLVDYGDFILCRHNLEKGEFPDSLVVLDPFKRNFTACVFLEETLYPQIKKLKVVSKQMNYLETLYGGLVKNYLDKRVRETLPSQEFIPQAVE
jgi:hypothetical protein